MRKSVVLTVSWKGLLALHSAQCYDQEMTANAYQNHKSFGKTSNPCGCLDRRRANVRRILRARDAAPLIVSLVCVE